MSAPRATSRASEWRVAADVWSTASATRADGHRHVRTRVAVGDWIDVEVVNARAVRLERRERRVDELLHHFAIAVQTGHPLLFTSSMCTSIARTERPVRRSTS